MASDRRVVVTGLGAVTPLGLDASSTWASLVAGKSGVGPITHFDAAEFKTRIAAEVKGFEPDDHFEKREWRRYDRCSMFAMVAAREAMAQSSLDIDPDSELAARSGAVVGVGFGGMASFLEEVDVLRERGPSRMSPFSIPKVIANMPAGLVSIDLSLLGPVSCTVTACSASANAIGDAAMMIRRGAADVMVAGGAEAAIVDYGLAGFGSAKALSTRNDDPERASRPFDADRDGFVMGEGAGMLVLEDREHALARGAEIIAEFAGYGMSADAYHMTLPRPGGMGASRCMNAALADARLNPDEIGYINAHGTSTDANDATETLAIKLSLGSRAGELPVSSTKSMTGHLLGAAGAVEAIASIRTITDGVVPPTINYETPDPECDLDYVPNTAREHQVDHVLSNSFGFGGHNVSLVFSRSS